MFRFMTIVTLYTTTRRNVHTVSKLLQTFLTSLPGGFEIGDHFVLQFHMLFHDLLSQRKHAIVLIRDVESPQNTQG